MMVSGGKREGAGRKSRPAPKSKGIWCGQITDEQRDFIMQWLSPEDRYAVLIAAANKACTRLSEGGAKSAIKRVRKSKVISPAKGG
jgi:hypothetical protein